MCLLTSTWSFETGLPEVLSRVQLIEDDLLEHNLLKAATP